MFVRVWKGLAGHIQKWNELESIAIVCLLRALIYEGSGAQYNHPNNHLVSERTRQAAKRHKNIIDNRACSGLSADARGCVPPHRRMPAILVEDKRVSDFYQIVVARESKRTACCWRSAFLWKCFQLCVLAGVYVLSVTEIWFTILKHVFM